MMGIYFVNMLMLSHHSNNTGSIFLKKRMVVVASESEAKVLQFNELRKELFSPND
jgi:hypothetical protein